MSSRPGIVARVSSEQLLTRVRADVAAGHLTIARQRLTDAVRADTTRLDLREELAQLWRQEGFPGQAGRWSYLGDADAAEVAAFERDYPNLEKRMWALRWRGPEDACGPDVASRLVALRTEAEATLGRSVSWERRRVVHEEAPPTPLWRRALLALVFTLFLIWWLWTLGTLVMGAAAWLQTRFAAR